MYHQNTFVTSGRRFLEHKLLFLLEPFENRAAVPRSKVFLFLSSFNYLQTMINACQLQHIFHLFTEKLNTSEPPPGFSKGSFIGNS